MLAQRKQLMGCLQTFVRKNEYKLLFERGGEEEDGEDCNVERRSGEGARLK